MTAALRPIAATLFLAFAPLAAWAEDVLVFAAASLKTALDEVTVSFAETTGHSATVSFAGSSTLARQIQQGAPAQVFISANTEWMDLLEAEGRIATGTRSDLLGNTLVLIAADPEAEPVDFTGEVDFAGLLDGGRLAMALVQAVPAGIYGKAALESLGQWETVAPQVAQADNVRAALSLVSAGEAPYGIVYASDAIADPSVKVVATFPESSHPPIVYPAALVAGQVTDAATAFLDHLTSDAARAAFERQGFAVLVD